MNEFVKVLEYIGVLKTPFNLYNNIPLFVLIVEKGINEFWY